MATPENLQIYKDAGFNYLYIDWVFQENSMVSGYNFANGKLKKILDMAQNIGLKCVVFQSNVYGLSNSEESRINPQKANGSSFFNSQEELNAYVAKALKDLKDHPAFDGLMLVDEPGYLKFTAISEVYKAIKSVDSDINVFVNLLPYADNSEITHIKLYCGWTEFTAEQTTEMAYANYLEAYYNAVGKDLGFVMYDDYPMLNGRLGYSTTGNNVLPTYLYCNQVVSNFCNKYGLERKTIYQSSIYSNRENVTKNDINFMMNVGMAFGNSTFGYYTYYPIINVGGTALPDETGSIVNRNGVPNDKYYDIQKVTEEMQVTAKALLNFKYQGMQFKKTGTLPSNDYTNRLVNDEFNGALGAEWSFAITGKDGGIVLVTELYDEINGRYGYYVVNITDPEFDTKASVTLDFGSNEFAQIYQSGQVNNVDTNNGKLNISLDSGCGAFIIPFN